jgi:hypothetical protein
MRQLTPRRLALVATAPMLRCIAAPMLRCIVAALGGCGDDNDNSGANGATDLQSQFVRVVDRVSPQVVQIQTDIGFPIGSDPVTRIANGRIEAT